MQRDPIGLFLKSFGSKFLYKSSPIFLILSFLKTLLFKKKTAVITFCTTFGANRASFNCNIWSHWLHASVTEPYLDYFVEQSKNFPSEYNSGIFSSAVRMQNGLSFRFSYIDQPGDVGKMTLLLPQPAHLQSWTMNIQTDLNVQVNLFPTFETQV